MRTASDSGGRHIMGLRHAAAIMAGFVAFGLVTLIALLVTRAGWPAYADAEPTRTYTFGMLVARLVTGSLATLAGGAMVACVDLGAARAPTIFGFVLLLLSVVWHLGIWEQYPVWYHLCWFAAIVPFAVLGGRLAGRAVSRW